MNVLMVVGLAMTLSTTLWIMTPTFAQTNSQDNGYHAADDNDSESDRSNLPNIGVVGLLGLIGLLGLRRGRQKWENEPQ
ncbi:WGxxGxxG family protein [Spirosoma rhododendri]|uniref:Uncharacterized protein n=1 Tax=Spirosoma rhododendri TaxID=2728024 RepID=A0A7L5DV29_9BACT|nr:WGxxGxxG family protein [Spirosoma rhododendri]QJD80448.1 hypothetical protein HH216_19975 [Spirosoma rhododendri]